MFLYIFILLLVGILYQHFKSAQKYHHIPGPPSLPVLGNTLDLISGTEKKCTEWAAKYGPIYKYKFLFWHLIVVADPQALKQVLLTNESNYTKNNFLYKLIADIVGENLVTMTNVAAHKKLRSTISEAFNKNNTVDILTDFDLLALDIIGRVAFASDFNALEQKNNKNGTNRGEHIHELVKTAFGALGQASPVLFVPFLKNFSPSYKAQMAATNELSTEMYKIIASKRETAYKLEERKEEKSGQKDLLDILVTLKDENGNYMNEKSICEQSKMFLLAGHETSSSALTWIIYLLSRYPDIQTKLANEILSLTSSEDNTNMETLDKLQYLNKVIKEGMRVFPPAITLMRKCEHDDTLGGYNIPGGAAIMINPFVVHNLNENWPNASLFDPERWNSEDSVPLGAYIPFLHGSRNCIGNKFALIEIKAILSILVRHFTFSLPSDHNPEKMKIAALPTLRASPRLQIIIRNRE